MKYTTIGQLRAELARRNGIGNGYRYFCQEQITAEQLLEMLRTKRHCETASQYFETREQAQEYAFLMSLQGKRFEIKDTEDGL